MEREEVYERLTEIFRDIFDDEEITISDDTTSSDIEGWDSIVHISLMDAIEEEFDIHFDMKTIVKLENVGEMVDVILEEV